MTRGIRLTQKLETMTFTHNEALANPGARGLRPPLTLGFGGPSYTIWRPSAQFKG